MAPDLDPDVDPDETAQQFKVLPPIIPASAAVVLHEVEELPFGGPEGGGDD